MREIKFRAWDIKTGEWRYGYIIFGKDNSLAWIITEGYEATYGSTPDQNIFRVDSETVGQLTGLKDKNGKEIYEGDIVAIDLWQGNEHGYIPEDGVIQWHQESCAFKWFSGDKSDLNNYWLSQADTKQREVIGNIYEDKELLK